MTYSVVAFDSANGQFGIAVASCVPLETVRRVPGVVGGRGAFVTQSYLFDESGERARTALETGASAETALAAVVDPAFDPAFEQRQYAIVDADGGTALFTGEQAVFFAAHREGRLGTLVYTLQGNFLNGEAVLDNLEAGFVADVCDLPARLVRALETASFDRGGDSRCTPYGRPARAAVVYVPSAGVALEVDTGEFERVDPTLGIRAQFERWRDEHPCATTGATTNTQDGGCRTTRSPTSSPSLDLPLVGAALLALFTLRRWRSLFRSLRSRRARRVRC